MKILIIVIQYLPNSKTVAAKMLHELAVEFYKRGHYVDVITPDHDLLNDIKTDVIDGITVHYFKSGELRRINLVKRAINEFLLSFQALKKLKVVLRKNKYDYIVYYSPTIFFGLLVRRLKILNNCSSLLVLRDFFPQWIIDNGTIKSYSPVALYFKFFEKINYRSADTIAIQSPKNLEWFNSVHNKKSNKRTILLYNWAKNNKVNPDGSFRKKYSLEDKVLFFYGGNIGYAQDMMNIVRLAEKMKSEKNAIFIILGDGDEELKIKKAISEKGLKNLFLLPSVDQLEFKKILAEMDIGLFTLAKHHKTHNFPGKLLGYMTQGIPILGSINPDNDLKDTVENYNAGLISINGDDELFYSNAMTLLHNSTLRRSMGKNAKKMLDDLFSVESAADIILNEYKFNIM